MASSECVPSAGNPCRANLDIMPDGTAMWMYILTALAAIVFLYGMYQMVAVWRMGREWKPGSLKAGLKHFVGALATHAKFKRDAKPGLAHKWIFYGFMALFLTTTLVAIDADFVELVLGGKMLDGWFYLGLELFADAFGIVFLVGLGYMFYRRFAEKPDHIHTSRPEAPWFKVSPDAFALGSLFLIGVTGFLMEGMRIRHQIIDNGIDYAQWSFVGNAISLAFQNASLATIETYYVPLWWFHFGLWIGVLAVLPWTKLKHIFTSSLNLIFVDPERQGRADLSKPFDLQEMMNDPNAEMPEVGVRTIRDFTWKDRLAFDACTNCGRCEAQCPAHAAGRPLSPRKLIQDLKAHMWEDARKGKNHESVPLTDVGMDTAIEEATLWSCTTCRACMTECPVDINHVDMILDMRRGLVNESKLDEHQTKLLVNLTNAGNPYGFAATDRANWVDALPSGVEVPRASEKAAKGETFEYLWWIGCSGSYDPRNQEVTKSIATILNASGVNFAILGEEERCNGDPARRLGEEGRFQQSVMENLMTLEQYGVKKIIAQCPHCFNTMGQEYPKFGATFEVIHHTQLIENLIEEGKVPLVEGKKMDITYHDSCYLGRHNDIFEAPRRVMESVNGLPVLEMAANRDQGLCCGAGGSNMWYEVPEDGERINVIRAKQAAETEATTVATACPFCLTMMTDGLSLSGNDPDNGGTMNAKDLAEIVAEHLDWSPPEPEPAEAPEETGSPAPVAMGGWVG
ncbi:MAG: heterodisulfide reductase-related iron-sulfur binding cluster [Thermoplasmatota archaeon]